jgi:hypothetical protein
VNVHPIDEAHIAVIERRPSGVGTFVWVGELRTLADDEPVTAWVLHHYRVERHAYGQGAKPCHPVSVGTSEAQVLALLVARARDIKESAA